MLISRFSLPYQRDPSMKTIEQRLDALEERNRRVEADKAWETSFARRAAIIILTYCVVVIFLSIIHNPEPWINAIVPAMGFLLSTLTIGLLKQAWLKKYSEKM